MLLINDIQQKKLAQSLQPIDLKLTLLGRHEPITGSYWGAPEAGLLRSRLFVRPDTPVHSALHETAHFICMTPGRRAALHTDAGGTDLEESAVCFLQLCLAELIPELARPTLMEDMDAWGYSFRLGSTQQWFEHDSEEARLALRNWGLIDDHNRYLFTLRGTPAADTGR